ncbi:glycosyltransferase [Cognatitamlana onchidii]|uniref:glycosyltransferase n=1 Tax=Cognatitamlana onchidii TaxID=2562860 RepID=UPI0010A5F518|nr:glycosyltransferase [Algibacter onchidii]
MKVEIWGTYPPPIGGVSIHIMRFIHEVNKLNSNIVLKDFNGLDENEFDYIIKVKSKLNEFFALPFRSKMLIHLHSNKFIVFVLLLIFGRKHKIGMTIHNKNLVKTSKGVKKKLTTLFLRRLDFIILNDPEYANQFTEAFKIDKLKTHVLPAYIKPLETERSKLPKKVLQFRQHKEFLISANAFMLRFEEGVDIYGFDLLIDLVYALKKKDINVGLIFCLPQIGNQQYYGQLCAIIKDKSLEKDILILQEKLPNAFQIWEASDLFIRPTTTDIEGVSVKEALDFNTPVIASNVCKRPKEAVLFKSRDFEELLSKTFELYKASKAINKTPISFNGEKITPKILEIYLNS